MTMQPTKGSQTEPEKTIGAADVRKQQSIRSQDRGTLAKTARLLAATHQETAVKKTRRGLAWRLPYLAEWLHAAHTRFAARGDDEPLPSYAGEWMLDNYYVIERALRQVIQDLPKGYEAQLPKLLDERVRVGQVAMQNMPRVYALAHAFLHHERQQVEPERLVRFVAAYQEVTSLTTGEVWALPIMMRLALLESLSLAAGRLVQLFEQPTTFSIPSHSRSSTLAESQESTTGNQSEPLTDREQIDEEVVAHAIPSLRTLDGQNWREFFEEVSLVHKTLCGGPAGIYARMDFASRDHYRDVIEKLALSTGIDENIIAQEAVHLAFRASQIYALTNGQISDEAADNLRTLPRECHTGYYLVDAGRARLEENINYHPRGMEKVRRRLLAHPTTIYLGGAGLLTLVLTAVSLWYGLISGAGPLMLLLIGLLSVIPTSTIALNTLNSILTRVLEPRTLPKLDFSDGVPDSCQTMVVIPALISTIADVESLTQQLELHYLRSTDGTPANDAASQGIISNNAHLPVTFALLSDFGDAPQEEMPEDRQLIDAAIAAVDELNTRYAKSPFYLFHRRRLWNESEGVWMGWERKRGKLHEFNRLLRGDESTTYAIQRGDLAHLSTVRYVITLDADTILPRGEALRLIGTLAHPLNCAQFSAAGEVVAGYTILQPRTDIQPTTRPKSFFSRVFGGDTGFDLYTLAVSDIYQDLFGEGIFVGKGIYEVDPFELSLAGRVPDNAILSHDLFEGIHGRAGLVTDVVLYEDYPPHYLINVLRSHRWVRGDWQLLPWLFSQVPARDPAGGIRYIRNSLSLIDRWKIFDNLRRSLLSPMLLAFFVAGWTVLPGSPWVWTLLAVLAPSTTLITTMFSGIAGLIHASDPQIIRQNVRNHAIRWLLFIAFLPYESLLLLDAILTTLVRLYVRRRRLLQWVTAARTVRLFGDEMSAATTFNKMLPSMLCVASLLFLVMWVAPYRLPVAAPFLAVWLLAWWIAHAISRPQDVKPTPLSAEQRQDMRILARRTWLFYEHFVGPDDNWLPPDHFQEEPRGVVAHRTSPTNIGMYLLSALAAYDLGYIGTMNLAARLQSTFDTLERLDRYRGHFVNWIDTRTLEPLPPRYVSTVDSGNLAGALIALKQGCLQIPESSIWQWEKWQGLLDLLPPLSSAGSEVAGRSSNPLSDYLAEMTRQIRAVQDEPSQWPNLLRELANSARPAINQRLMTTIQEQSSDDDGNVMDTEMIHSCRLIIDRIQHHLDDMKRDSLTLLPWLDHFEQSPQLFLNAESHPELHRLWQNLRETLPATVRLDNIAFHCSVATEHIAAMTTALDEATPEETNDSGEGWKIAVDDAREWCQTLNHKLSESTQAARQLEASFSKLAADAEQFVTDMNFGYLFNKLRQVFHIGYNIDTGELDANFYDLIASEARIASLVAIAKRDVPQSHWLHLGRPLTQISNGERVLLSWSGTMFEYLMPPLLLHSYPETLLYESCRASVERQIEIGRQNKTPWGISESGFYTFDAAMNYQYRAFGAPGLGFKRGLEDDQVIAPYASLLAISYRPQAVWQNFQVLRELGMMGRYGLFEAIDFTPARLNLGQEHAIVRSYMAHHQGMILLALLNYLQDHRMVNRFHADPRVQSVELLLQEGVPVQAPLQFPHQEEDAQLVIEATPVSIHPWSVPVDTPMPLVHFLSNGQYGTLITNAGGGYSRWREIQLTRWRADTTQDDWGSWIYLREIDGQRSEQREGDQRDDGTFLWSATRQPTGVRSSHEEVVFHPHKADFRRRDRGITLHTEVSVAPSDNVEIRQIHLTNDTDQPRRLHMTSYSEVVLGPSGGDERHQAFAKLFVESEYVESSGTLLFHRRPRAADEQTYFLAHTLVTATEQESTIVYESDRARLIGRCHTDRRPQALTAQSSWLSGSTGATLDPVMSLGQEIELAPHATSRVALLTIAGETRTDVLALVNRYQNWGAIDRALQEARSAAHAELRKLELTESRLESVQTLLSLLLYPHPARRAGEAILKANRKGQSGLWAFGVSGDFPILFLRIQDESQGELLQEILRAHSYWRRRGVQIDVVILNRQATNYGQPVENFIQRMISRMDGNRWLNQRGGLFVLRSDQLSESDRILLQTTARVVLDGAAGELSDQLAGLLTQPTRLPIFEPPLEHTSLDEAVRSEEEDRTIIERPIDLQFDNGIGGFSVDGREYVIYLKPGETTPAPWINVVANPDFGCIISESGGGYTWAINSGENRLTTWRNDPVSDQPAEVVYLRDEQTADVWSPTPQPVPAESPYLIRHGAGYSTFEHVSHGLIQKVRIFVAPDAPVKVIQLRLDNITDQHRRITATYYAEWVLGVDRSMSGQFIVPEYEEDVCALLARNTYSADFSQRVAFVAGSQEPNGVTTDRTEFLGRMGSLSHPAALRRIGLSGRVQSGLDPCAALQLHIELPPRGTKDIYFVIGQETDRQSAVDLVARFQRDNMVEETWQAVHRLWEDTLGVITVDTPDAAMNLLLNRWLLYQALSCRLWGRSALYQSSGAYGFRDQLQDSMALIHARSDLVREQILRAARHQFEEGDVLHWWHPPAGQGVRTRITDDLLWLPFVTAHYIAATGDETVLQEKVPFLQAEPLAHDEEERYAQYDATEESYTVYEHCLRAIRKGTTAGTHGIPLMGAGDWNDGMNRVGIEGKGESIWLGWFLHATMSQFAVVCDGQGDTSQAEMLRRKANAITQAIEEHGWDGDWYRRAYYDDGTPLGSAQNRECRIDSIAQSWSVISGASDEQRARQAMQSVLDRLVRWEDRLILLFTPPFDKTEHDPGYIKGYVPGVRENGGQYTHAALWTIWAFAELGKGDVAHRLFELINPILRADSCEKADLYKVEPYVISADVYGVHPHVGRGGWTWYTGSSGWMYRLGVEAILGLRRVANGLCIEPQIPEEWPGFKVRYHHEGTTYHITVIRMDGVNIDIESGRARICIDDTEVMNGVIPLVEDGREHHVQVWLKDPGDES